LRQSRHLRFSQRKLLQRISPHLAMVERTIQESDPVFVSRIAETGWSEYGSRTTNAISRLMWSRFNYPIRLGLLSEITFGLSQSDHIKWLLLQIPLWIVTSCMALLLLRFDKKNCDGQNTWNIKQKTSKASHHFDKRNDFTKSDTKKTFILLSEKLKCYYWKEQQHCMLQKSK